MKKLSKKQRCRDVQLAFHHRTGKTKQSSNRHLPPDQIDWKQTNRWIKSKIPEGLNVSFNKKKRITLHLPETMNFYDMYESTALHIAAIRKLVGNQRLPNKAYKLVSVNFDNLKQISTSSALVLTAELSKWDDAIRQRLRPNTDNWDCDILKQFTELGFFDLFNDDQPEKRANITDTCKHSGLSLVKYIKGRCGDKAKTRILKAKIGDIVGDKISKWTFLDSGLSEAITNVSHHAYPKDYDYSEEDKNWYLTGSYNEYTNELKVVFYDQGIGIPKSLPSSEIWEKVLAWFSKYSIADRKRHEVLLKAAVELDRTSTLETDRGKGLQDLLEFVKHRGDGYLSILSLKGLFKYSMKNGTKAVKSEHFSQELYGTLIIWSATLA